MQPIFKVIQVLDSIFYPMDSVGGLFDNQWGIRISCSCSTNQDQMVGELYCLDGINVHGLQGWLLNNMDWALVKTEEVLCSS